MNQEKAKKPFYKRIWFIVLVAVIVVVALTKVAGGNLSTTASSTSEGKTTTNSENKTEKTDKKTETEQKNHALGETFQVGDLEFKVENKQVADSIGDDILKEQAKNKFLMFDVTVTNHGNDEAKITNNFFKLKLGEKTYETSEEGGVVVALGDKSIIYKGINPDSSLRGTIVFDLGENIINDPGLLLQVQTGFFGTQTDLVKVN